MIGRRVDAEHGEPAAGGQRDTVAQLDDDEDQPGQQVPVASTAVGVYRHGRSGAKNSTAQK